ncbi:uncharacterized protein G2W53_026916 [Senna tora]|uniref:Uncharacterized protein n=1 Tax=Senna tora TaxID=362788 RepID=A0A834THX7_9FABA|nr:uncharacterized protein G2W53_026916 [Senna tora]
MAIQLARGRNLRWTTTWIAVGRRQLKIYHPREASQEISRRSESVSRRTTTWVHMLGENEAYDIRKPPKKFQGNLTCVWPNLRWTTTLITVGRRH